MREALRLRSLEKPVAVALVLSKIDALFKDAEEARTSLTDEVLRTSFEPLVHLIEQSSRVSDAVIIPLTAFGFGNAVLRDEGSQREGAHPEPEDEPFGSEPIWLLREDVSAQPSTLCSSGRSSSACSTRQGTAPLRRTWNSVRYAGRCVRTGTRSTPGSSPSQAESQEKGGKPRR